MKHPLEHFIDPETSEVYQDKEYHDPHGVDLIGEDEDGRWWGTERAAWTLSHHPKLVCVCGYIDGRDWQGWFVGTEKESILWAECHRVRVEIVESTPFVAAP